MKSQLPFLIFVLMFVNACKTMQKNTIPVKTGDGIITSGNLVSHQKLKELFDEHAGYFNQFVTNPDHRIQVIWSVIERDKNNIPSFTDYYFHVNESEYFYPASTVKLPVAALALQKLREINLPGVDMNTTMITGTDYSGQSPVYNDPSSEDGRPTIANYIKKILLVSDNDAFNRLYEFLGQEYINNTLLQMGYGSAQIIHRLEISLTEDQNRHTNPVKFFDTTGRLLYEQKGMNSQLVYAERKTLMGKGYMQGGRLVKEPFDFSKKNRLVLTDLHQIVRSILFPESVPESQRFGLSRDDYLLLRKYMSMYPQESNYPQYNRDKYWDNYVKFLFYGSEKTEPEQHIRIFNKVGDAYGFLIDAAYFADFKNNIEFMLSAVIHCNSDEIFNDNKYEYDSIGFPFMKQLGQIIYKHHIKNQSDQSRIPQELKFNYRE